MAKWKYQITSKTKAYNKEYNNRLYFDAEKPKNILITNWEFIDKAGAGPLFKCFVEMEDGKKVDKNLAIWNFDLKQELKIRLKGKKPDTDKVQLTILKHGEDMEETFEVL